MFQRTNGPEPEPISVDARLCLTRGFLLLVTGVLFLLALFDSQDHFPLRAWLETTGMIGGFYFGLREFGRGLVAELGWPR